MGDHVRDIFDSRAQPNAKGELGDNRGADGRG